MQPIFNIYVDILFEGRTHGPLEHAPCTEAHALLPSLVSSMVLPTIQGCHKLRKPRTFLFFYFFQHRFYFPALLEGVFYPQQASGQAVARGVHPSPPRYVPLLFAAHRVQHPHCSSIFIECSKLTLSRFLLVNFLFARKSHAHALGETWLCKLIRLLVTVVNPASLTSKTDCPKKETVQRHHRLAGVHQNPGAGFACFRTSIGR